MAKPLHDTGWQKIVPQAEVIDTRTGEDVSAYGAVEMVSGLESKPCCMCKSFDGASEEKVVRHLIARGLKPRLDGKFETPIAKDFKGRVSMVLDPKGSGYCMRDSIIVEGLASCDEWKPTITISDFQRRMLRTGKR